MGEVCLGPFQNILENWSYWQDKIYLTFFFMKVKSAIPTATFKIKHSNTIKSQQTSLILTCQEMVVEKY